MKGGQDDPIHPAGGLEARRGGARRSRDRVLLRITERHGLERPERVAWTWSIPGPGHSGDVDWPERT